MKTLNQNPWPRPVKLLHTYQNGGYEVSIQSDGTKTRAGEGAPLFPESVDLKITGYCDNSHNCPFCHEMSNLSGQHGDLRRMADLWEGMPAGVEIAIGGGNPLAHPMLLPFLETCAARGHLCNLTINQMHVEPFADLIRHLVDSQLVHGIGLSVRDIRTLPRAVDHLIWAQGNLVYHLILGLNTWDEFARLMDTVNPKVLLLGYKQFGWGTKHKERNPEIDDEIANWRRHLPLLFHQHGTISFDNLAIEQLELKRWLSPEKWGAFYMGDDGSFTMYVDAVKQEYAVGSTSVERHAIGDEDTLRDIFAKIRA